MSKRRPCAACGAPTSDGRTTFMVDRFVLSGEFRICETCWTDGLNDEDWNERITQAIIERRKASA